MRAEVGRPQLLMSPLFDLSFLKLPLREPLRRRGGVSKASSAVACRNSPVVESRLRYAHMVAAATAATAVVVRWGRLASAPITRISMRATRIAAKIRSGSSSSQSPYGTWTARGSVVARRRKRRERRCNAGRAAAAWGEAVCACIMNAMSTVSFLSCGCSIVMIGLAIFVKIEFDLNASTSTSTSMYLNVSHAEALRAGKT